LARSFCFDLCASVRRGQIIRAAERFTCPLKNTIRIPSLNNTANYRIPDLLDAVQKLIGDTRNVRYLSMTPQLQDYASYAQMMGYQFQLTVSANTVISSTVNSIPNIVIVREPLP
jgi:hypothetical protein